MRGKTCHILLLLIWCFLTDSYTCYKCGEQRVSSPHSSQGNRIVNGVQAVHEQFPWLVSVQYWSLGRGMYLHYCGASLVHESVVLTAAHCVPNQYAKANSMDMSRIRIVIGCLRWDGASDAGHRDPGCQFIDVDDSDFIMHPWYLRDSKQDIAILVLRNPVSISESVGTICLPPENEMYAGMATIAGWGKHSENQTTSHLYFGSSRALRTADVNLLSPSVCTASYGPNRFNSKVNVCAGFTSGARDTCQGDSGGPLMAKVKDRVFLIGTVSFGKGCASEGFPGVYVRTAAKIRWIDNVTGAYGIKVT